MVFLTLLISDCLSRNPNIRPEAESGTLRSDCIHYLSSLWRLLEYGEGKFQHEAS